MLTTSDLYHRPHLLDDLEITIVRDDGSSVFLRLHQCGNLKKLEGC